MKSLYIRRFRPGRRFTGRLDPNLTHAGRIPAEQPESIGKTRYIKYKIILKIFLLFLKKCIPNTV